MEHCGTSCVICCVDCLVATRKFTFNLKLRAGDTSKPESEESMNIYLLYNLEFVTHASEIGAKSLYSGLSL